MRKNQLTWAAQSCRCHQIYVEAYSYIYNVYLRFIWVFVSFNTCLFTVEGVAIAVDESNDVVPKRNRTTANTVEPTKHITN